MKTRLGLLLSCLLTLPAVAAAQSAAQAPQNTQARSIAAIGALEQQARSRTTATARVPLAPATSSAFEGIESLEAKGSGRVPNYLRALALKPGVAGPFAHLLRTFVYEGTVPPPLKLAMATRIAQVNNSAYGAAHLTRLLRTTAEGTALLAALRDDRLTTLPPAERLALRWAELQTVDIYGMPDDEFRQMRGYYTDSEIVELTFTVCFFNYFTRMVEGLGLPVEAWVLDASVKPEVPAAPARDRTPVRVALLSDEEIKGSAAALDAASRPAAGNSGLGLGMANSQRAMFRVPALANAWREFGAANSANALVGRDILLQVSFAVSMANGCRYCTIHQVVGLRRLGVDPTKLLAMEKDDTALTPRELAAVVFARKVTAAPASVTDADYAALKKEFQDQGALEVLLQACNFSFMNRFTDGLRLPSEDEAIKVYMDVYKKEFTRKAGRTQ